MYEMIWRFDVETLDEERLVRPIFERLGDSDLFEPGDYDLNQKEQWRHFDLDRVVVDALTQRTQLVRIKGGAAGEMAMVAMGKHGEEPTAVVRLSDAHAPSEIVADWSTLFEKMPLQTAILTSPAWREAVDAAGIDWDEGRVPRAIVCAWRPDGVPEAVSELESRAADGPISLERREGCTVVWLAPAAEIEGAAHREALERMFTP